MDQLYLRLQVASQTLICNTRKLRKSRLSTYFAMRHSFVLSNNNSNSADSKLSATALCDIADDDSSSVPSVEEASDSSSFKAKSCSFNFEANTSHEVEHLDDVPMEELDTRWYSQEELEAIKTEILSLFRRIKRKEVDPHDLDETSESLRGLEDRYCREKRTQQKSRKAAAENAVMHHQEHFAWNAEAGRKQEEEDIESQHKVVAISYKLASKESRNLALELGRLDAQAAALIHSPPEEEKPSSKARKLGSSLRRSLPKQLRKLTSSITSVASKNTV